LEPLLPRVAIRLEGREVRIRVWRRVVGGVRGDTVPVYFLDTDVEENDPRDRALCGTLYGGDDRYRLSQEAVLGLGGVAMLRALGYADVHAYHMNEGHSALLTLALLEERLAPTRLAPLTEADKEAVRKKCVFTTHTPVAAGHDQFPAYLVEEVLGPERFKLVEANGCCPPGVLNMTYLGLSFSRYINGVAMRHREISQNMFPHYPVDSITNGVQASTWASPPFAALYDRHIPEWRRDNLYLRHAIRIPLPEIRRAHEEAKAALLGHVRGRTGIALDPQALTIGFARRATAYKRPALLFSDLDRLKGIVGRAGPLQVVYGGKAHPRDEPGKDLIRRIFDAAKALGPEIRVVYMEEYDMALAREMCAGVDVWLNTPHKPQEASGTSGMKAAMNGVPSFSVLDGWWIEGHVEGVTGWSIGRHWEADDHEAEETNSLYDKLERVILPLYYRRPEDFDRVRQSAIAVNASFFNAQRMVSQYFKNAYYHA
jgi:starch phosphorylase